MSKTIISLIDNMFIHDASSLHGLVPNVSTYTLNIGDPSSAHSTSQEVALPSDVLFKSLDASMFSLVGHVHDVSYSGLTEEGGLVIPTGTLSKPEIIANNTTSSINYVTSCTATASVTNVSTAGDLIMSYTYNSANESMSFSMGTILVDMTKNSSTFSVVTNMAPELSEAPVFTGNALSLHDHNLIIKTYTGLDIAPNQMLYSTTDGNPINVAAKMTALGADSLPLSKVNNVVSNELVDGSTYLLTCAKPITLVGAIYTTDYDMNALNDTLVECGPVFGSVGDTSETQNTNLLSMTLPQSTMTLGKYAVNDCSVLTDIAYICSADGWNDIAKDSSWNYGTNDIRIR